MADTLSPPVSPSKEDVREHLDRILGSACFANSGRLRALLKHLVEAWLADRASGLKESVLAVEVFGRRGDHDPHRDAIVRVSARNLRAKLSDYYSTEGAGEPFRVELPKGAYIPHFQWVEPEWSPRPRRQSGSRVPARCWWRPPP